MQKVRIEDYKCGMTTVLSGVKEYVLKILGRKCTQMLTLIILCWQNYGQFLFFILFLFSTFSIIVTIFIKKKKSHWRRGKKKTYPVDIPPTTLCRSSKINQHLLSTHQGPSPATATTEGKLRAKPHPEGLHIPYIYSLFDK